MPGKMVIIKGSLVIACLMTFLFPANICAKEVPLIKLGDPFPEIPMPAPADAGERAYLGLPKGKTFTFRDIKADLVLVEILSVYCPSCQRQAPHYNRLYELIESDPGLKGRIKIMGIGAGNGETEIERFKERYKVKFPVIPDADFLMHAAIGGSRTPFSIYVRQVPSARAGLVAGTHLGRQSDTKRLLADLAALMTLNPAVIREEGGKTESRVVSVKPILEEKELQLRVKAAFLSTGGRLMEFDKIVLGNARSVYTGIVKQDGKPVRLFAEVVSRPPTCDVCHDIHFIYVFDATGEVLGIEPLQLTKYGNEPWDENDVRKIRGRVVGMNLLKPHRFDPEIDAVSSATITSAVIFNSISRGSDLIRELKKKGLFP